MNMNTVCNQQQRKPIMIFGQRRSIPILLVFVLVGFGILDVHGPLVAASYTAKTGKQSRFKAIERIILTFKADPASTQAVTWRTKQAVNKATAQISPANPSPDFGENAKVYHAITSTVESGKRKFYYHSVNFTNLTPDTLYSYRVGADDNWSEWFQFRTASDQPGSFSFIYFGDAQNEIRSLWSRAIRSAFLASPKARFMIHAGDIVEHGDSDSDWQEWFDAAGWIFAMVPSMPAAGNHEYRSARVSSRKLSPFWQPQFMLPENGVKELNETVYYVDYQGVRFVVLNSNRKLDKQARWLEKILARNPNNWTVAVLHHPVHALVYIPDVKSLDQLWKPIFDKFKVDLVLQGHEHIYARMADREKNSKQLRGPVYITSVSGPKMYELKSRDRMDRIGENTQLFQVISVSRDILYYRAVTVTGETYDAFNILKGDNGRNQFFERIPSDAPERGFN
jgi:3',5'-cyclic AMP phosphodiesterase CpdA